MAIDRVRMAKIISFAEARRHYDGDLFTLADGSPRTSWWASPALWSAREWIESVSRPTEDRALLNTYLHARALCHMDEYTKTFTACEFRAFTCEIEALQKHPHLTGWARYEWIAGKMGGYDGEWTARRVKAVLDDVTEIIQHTEIERLLDVMGTARQGGWLSELETMRTKMRGDVFRETYREVVRERKAA